MAVSVANAGPLRKNSMAIPSNQDNEAKVQPNYLRHSIGSCHDLCKFGRRRDLTVKIVTVASEKPASSPNKGRKPDKSNNLQKKSSLFCSSGSPSSARSPTSQVRGREIQPGAKKVAEIAKSPRKLKTKPLEANGPSRLGGRNIETSASKQTGTPKARKIVISVPATGSPSHRPKARKVLKEASHPKNKNNDNDDELESPSVEEKILFVTELNSENQPGGENVCDDSLQSQEQIQDSSAVVLLQETEGDASYIDKEVDQVEYSPSSSPKGKNNSRSLEGKLSRKSSSSSLVSLLSSSSAPETGSSPKMRRVYVYRESDGNENEPVKVVLRHPNADEKKTSEVLFNSVIEETAKELAKKRKGAVKSLVGAFETVISLQDLSLLEQLRSDDLPNIQ